MVPIVLLIVALGLGGYAYKQSQGAAKAKADAAAREPLMHAITTRAPLTIVSETQETQPTIQASATVVVPDRLLSLDTRDAPDTVVTAPVRPVAITTPAFMSSPSQTTRIAERRP